MNEHSDDILLKINQTYQPPQQVLDRAFIDESAYRQMYKESIDNPERFWGEMAEQELVWFSKWDKVREWNHPDYQWFVNGKINITYNCLDRHILNGRRNKVAFIYTNEKDREVKITYGELHEKVCRFANALRALGLDKGDRVTIYMPLMIEQIIAMLACARLGIIHSVVFAGFSASALRLRIEDAGSPVVITSTWTSRRGKKIDLKEIFDDAIHGLPVVKHVIVAQRDDDDYELNEKEKDFHELLNHASPDCPAPQLDAEDPLYILYTSGTTGKPKGVLHTQGGYNLFTHVTSKYVFDIHEDDIFWCTADTGWVTGHSYIVYGPLSVGATSVIVEGTLDFPDPGRWWSIVEKYRVNIFYTAPTAVRLIMKHGKEWPDKYDLSSLRILGSVGEPINPEAWVWYYEHIGRKNCAIVDTWWQTETGGHMLVTLPSMPQKPGRAGLPFFGVEPDVVTKKMESVESDKVGTLIIRQPWPSALRTCWGNQERYEQYWREMDGVYYPGDLATRDADGYIMILGRADDVLNVSGHRIGTAEVESALVSHPMVAEAAVIGKPHEIKGESIKAFVTLIGTAEGGADEITDIKAHVRKELGGIGVPDEIDFVDKLPKTRSGKIMRRVLKAKELGKKVGDTSTLED